MNIKQTINKLQKALLHKGYIYKINTYQFYSEQQNRRIAVVRLKWIANEWEKVKEKENENY